MQRVITIASEPINEAALATGRAMSDGMGAVVCFLGVVRAQESGAAISGIEYEAFEEMARHQFEKILDEAAARWPLESVRLVHRTGFVPANTPSLWVEVIAPHRGEAFAACQYLIDEMKKRVPIWKHPR